MRILGSTENVGQEEKQQPRRTEVTVVTVIYIYIYIYIYMYTIKSIVVAIIEATALLGIWYGLQS